MSKKKEIKEEKSETKLKAYSGSGIKVRTTLLKDLEGYTEKDWEALKESINKLCTSQDNIKQENIDQPLNYDADEDSDYTDSAASTITEKDDDLVDTLGESF